jgi:hypothetical protein
MSPWLVNIICHCVYGNGIQCLRDHIKYNTYSTNNQPGSLCCYLLYLQWFATPKFPLTEVPPPHFRTFRASLKVCPSLYHPHIRHSFYKIMRRNIHFSVISHSLCNRRKWWSSFQKWQIRKNKMSFGFKLDLFSFALMIMLAFHTNNSVFSNCFPKKGKGQNHSSAPLPLPLSTLLQVGYMPRLRSKISYQWKTLNIPENEIPSPPPLSNDSHLNKVMDCIRIFE